MAIDLKTFGDLYKLLGPSDEDRQTLARTFFGKSLGQAILVAGMFAAYFAAIGAIYENTKEFLPHHATLGGIWFWVFFVSPFACIVLFAALPTAWRAMRERRLKAAVISGETQFKPGYFRLHPYTASERDIFRRLDGADIAILHWLRSAQTSLLYLSGSSGTGKSSVLAANVLPKLRDEGWVIIEARLFGEDRLRAAIFAAGLFTHAPPADLSLRELLEKAAEARSRKKNAPPLLIAIDQFEEFLILHNNEDRLRFAALLNDLVTRPIAGLRLLLVFRSDYRALVFKLDLPPLVSGQNWHELAPYDRAEAALFLQSGGRAFAPEALDAMFRGLDKIEDTRGIYRPITLNMIGLVLERMGEKLEGDPEHLIQSYLKASLTAGDARDFTKRVLEKMITDAGTKEPRSEAELAASTGLEHWQVKATLADLSQRALVRRLEGREPIWEIAHDFLARSIGQLIGRMKPSFVRRVRPLVAPVVLFGWIALGNLALPNWVETQDRLAQEKLRAAGATFSRANSGGLHISLKEESGELTSLLPDIKRLKNLRAVSLGVDDQTDLGPLLELTRLDELNINTDRQQRTTVDVSILGQLAISKLSFAAAYAGEALEVTGVEAMQDLRNLELSSTNVEFPSTALLPKLEILTIQSFFRWPIGNGTLQLLRGLPALKELDVSAIVFENLDWLEKLTNLISLSLPVPDRPEPELLAPLSALQKLEKLVLSDARSVTNLEPIAAIKGLRSLTLSGAANLESLEPLRTLSNLEELHLVASHNIKTLEPLKGKQIKIIGASPELLATLN